MKIRIFEMNTPSKKPFRVFYGKEKLAEFSTKELANDFASIYFVPPYTMQANIWYK
jgi:hypothetical protein